MAIDPTGEGQFAAGRLSYQKLLPRDVASKLREISEMNFSDGSDTFSTSLIMTVRSLTPKECFTLCFMSRYCCSEHVYFVEFVRIA